MTTVATVAVAGLPSSTLATTTTLMSPTESAPPAQAKATSKSGSKRHERQPSLRRANSVELTHRRMNSNGSNQHQPAPDVLPGAREGRQFTVGNVGNNGMIFLRPVIRPAQQRRQPPALALADTATAAASSSSRARRRSSDLTTPGSPWSGAATPRSPPTPSRESTEHADPTDSPPVPRLKQAFSHTHPPQHQRAHSFSTLSEKTHKGELDAGGVRVVVQPPDKHRPKTADQLSGPMLEVSIPNYRLGSPRFSARGTAILRSSVYTRNSTADGLRSSAFSDGEYEQVFPLPPGMPRASHAGLLDPNVARTWPRRPTSAQRHRPGGPIDPAIYDHLTFAPKSESPNIVRYSPVTGSIAAATPPRLIAQITSPSFLDYDLLSDFFLTFRSFMTAADLLAYLMARLQWAVDRYDDVGKIVKVRAFVALRHWILNYFVDDFVPDLALRRSFGHLLDNICQRLGARPDHGIAHLKLIGELNKCWRRSCDLYWDPPPGLGGGQPSSVNGDGDAPASAPGPAPVPAPVPAPDHPLNLDSRPPASTSLPPAPLATRPPTAVVRAPPPTIQITTEPAPRVISAASDASLHAISCSIPAMTFRHVDAVMLGDGAEAAHPIPLRRDNAALSSSAKATSPFPVKARAMPPRQRSGSISDALRDRSAPTAGHAAEAEDLPPPGSLIRGGLVPPSQVLVEPVVSSTANSHARMPLYVNNVELESDVEHRHPTVSGPGMRKLLGSVRRALSHKNGWAADTSHANQALAASFEGRNSPGTRHRALRATSERDPVRVDLLHDSLLETFRRMTADLDRAEVKREDRLNFLWSPKRADHDDSTAPAAGASRRRPRGSSVVSAGSKSIVIINDTVVDAARPPPPPLPLPAPQRALPPPPGPKREGATAAVGPASRAVSYAPTSLSSAGFGQPPKPGTSLRDASTNSPPSRRSHARSFKSTGSVSLRKYASFHSSMARPDTLRSFDATTRTGSDVGDDAGGPPARMLRRRPGGDLRAARKITDLEACSMRTSMTRPWSAGSLTTSISSSVFHGSGSVVSNGHGLADGEHQAREQRRRYSLGALAEVGDERAMSLMRTHSSQPNLRASFEAEVAKLARLPDEDEDGGIESTLRKLEGRFQRRESVESPLDYAMPSSTVSVVGTADAMASATHEDGALGETSLDDAAASMPEHVALPLQAPLLRRQRSASEAPSSRSEESYSSIPLLERGLSERTLEEDGRSHAPSSLSTPRASVTRRVRVRTLAPPGADGARESFLLDDEDAQESFLLDEDENLSDLSSEISLSLSLDPEPVPAVDERPASATTWLAPLPGTAVLDMGLSAHPLRHPPSPPPSTEPAFGVRPSHGADDVKRFPNPPLTPAASPQDRAMPMAMAMPMSASMPGAWDAGTAFNRAPQETATKLHMPFVLAWDPELVAQQLTLCEKDALSEIDWRDLVELKWRQTLPPVQNWVDYLRTQEPRGVELVIARFNVMVKWALSEVVMTRDVRERARTISRYIHTATYARRLRNFATMYQLTIALLSTDCSRLTHTWDLVPARDVRALTELEHLIQPTRNFYNLRVEMEMATPDEGCIPFIGWGCTEPSQHASLTSSGIYTHDLVFNSHRPSRLAGGTEGLVNFERYRTTAAVVKNLLRLLEGSTKYQFPRVDGLIDRCVWLAALPDAEIRSLSKSIQ